MGTKLKQKKGSVRIASLKGPYLYHSKSRLLKKIKIRSIKNAAQFTRSLLNIVDHVQMKYNNDVGEAIWMLTKPVLNYPPMPEETKKVGKDGNITVVKPNEMEIFMW